MNLSPIGKDPNGVKTLLNCFSVEITPGDRKSLELAANSLPKGTEAFIASLPTGRLDQVVETATFLRNVGLEPVPHLAARNLESPEQLSEFLKALSGEASVKRALVIGGDRDQPLGFYGQSLQILNSGLLQKHGIRKAYISCYPEGHPRIADDQLNFSRRLKLNVARDTGLQVGLVSQFCFETLPIVRMVRQLRQENPAVPVRVGLAGPVGPTTLLKYAAVCGVGASIRVIRERQSLAKNLMTSSTEDLLSEIAGLQSSIAATGIEGIHFFTFGALARTAELVARLRQTPAAAAV